MRALTATLYIDDSGPAPAAGVSVEVDGHAIVERNDVPPGSWFAVVDALGESLGVDLRAQLSAPITDLVTRLQDAVADGRAAQEQREQALTDWQKVATPESST